MLLNWVRLWERLRDEDCKKKSNPLSDPLEGAEWQGLLWALPFLSWVSGGSPRTGRNRPGRRLRSENDEPQWLVSKFSRTT
jgi:hypothetical protein